jgi:hypothetical protein
VAVAVLRQGLRIRVRCLQGLLVALLIWLSAWLPQALVVLWTETPAALQILTPELVWDYSEWATYGVALAACGVAAALLLPSAESQEQDVGWSLWTPFAAFLGMLLAPLVLLGTWALWQGGGMIDAPSPSPLMGPSGWPAVGPLASASLMGLTVSLLFGATHRALAGGWLARALKWTGLYVATIWSPAALFTSALNEVAPFVAFRVVVAVPAMVLVVLIVATGTVRVIPDRPPNRPPEARPGSAMEGP